MPKITEVIESGTNNYIHKDLQGDDYMQMV